MNDPKKTKTKKRATNTLTIRLKPEQIKSLKTMAEFFDTTPSRLASILLETGMVIADGLNDAQKEEGTKTNG